MLRFSRRLEYALILLGQLKTDSCLPLSQLAQSHHLSLKFLEQVAHDLKSAKLIAAKSGASGGYSLALPPQKIHLDRAISAIEGNWHLTDCLAHNHCAFLAECRHLPILKIAETSLRRSFAQFTIADLVKPLKNSATH